MPTDLPRLTASPSIYEFLAAHVDDVGRLPEHVTLPDEAPAADGGIRWAPGALDGVLGHHAGGGAVEHAAVLASLVAEAAERPDEQRLRVLLAECPDDVLAEVDPMIEQLVALGPTRDGVHRVGRWLAATATERGAVKLGIALLGVAGVGDAAGLLRTLGAHDEFTLYAAVAFANGADDGESEIWALASVVDGWGRIHCVERLRGTTDPAIRRWLLRTGFRNSVMNEYLAYLAATTGGLIEALRGELDRELLDAASDLIDALVSGGPAEDLDDWAEGADAVEAYLSVMTNHAASLQDYRGVAAIRSFLDQEQGWDERAGRGWTATRRTAFERACAELLGRPSSAGLATAALGSSDRADQWTANWVLRDLGVSTFDHHVAAIRANPAEGGWYEAWSQADDARAAQLVQLARDVLPLRELASGPALEDGFGPGSANHRALEWTLQALRVHPGLGADLLMVGLQSPVIRSRNMALNALEAWPIQAWPDGLRGHLTALADGDPDDRVRARAGELSQR